VNTLQTTVAAAALLALAGCPASRESPPLLTQVRLGGARALVTIGTTVYVDPAEATVFTVDGAGNAAPLEADGWEVEQWSSFYAPEGTRCVARTALVELDRTSPHFVRARLPFLHVDDGPTWCRTMNAWDYLDLRDGRLFRSFVSSLREDGRGRLYGIENEGMPFAVSVQEPDGGRLLPRAQVSASDVEPVGLWVDAGGNVAYTTAAGGLGLKPDVGPLTALDATQISRAWLGPDGKLRALRFGAGTTDLVRFDFGIASTLTALASWPTYEALPWPWPWPSPWPREEPGPLPAHAGGVPVLVGRTVVQVFTASDAAPERRDLGFEAAGVRAAFDALWLVAPDGEGLPTRIVRWTPQGADELLPAGAYRVISTGYHGQETTREGPWGVVPFSSTAALVLASRRSDGLTLWLRVEVGQEPQPVSLPTGLISSVSLD
jgi:hypothetical protein